MKAGVIKEGEKVRFGFHNFRHALATALVKMKVDAKTVQGMLRHEDFGTTMQLYAQSDMESMREAQGKFLEQLLGDRIHLLTETSSVRNRGSNLRIVGWIVGWEFSPKAAKFFRMMVARDGVEPPTPAFSECV